MKSRLLFIITAILLPVLCFSQREQKSGRKQGSRPSLRRFYFTGPAQGTSYHITYYAKDNMVTQGQLDSVLDKIDSSLSIYKPYSLISRFNNAVSGVFMDEHLRTVVQRSLEIYKESGGISDITVYPIVNAWGFGPDRLTNPPDSAAIRAMLLCVGSEKIHVEGNWLRKDLPCVKLDVNGIAQGYSVDVIAVFLEKNGIRNYLVEVGGELRTRGRKYPGALRMKIGIESPAVDQLGSDQPILKRIIQPKGGAITTSGNYRKFHQAGGKTISHLMDPHTGYPLFNELISVTIWAKDGITADGYDNALMGMGLKSALLFLKRHTEMEAYFIYKNDGGVVSDTATAGFYKIMEK
ncbi:FAD:protein FMN transferase [Flavitalea flava]